MANSKAMLLDNFIKYEPLIFDNENIHMQELTLWLSMYRRI